MKPMFHYANEKAGMEGLDRDEINRRIMAASKGSNYYKREEERALVVKEKVKHYMGKLENFQRNESLWKKTVTGKPLPILLT